MARLADLLEDYRNLVGRANWSIGRDIDAMSGYDPDLAEFVERSSLGTGAHGLGAGGLAGMIKASHGSPHAFTKFDFSKIGTGEGAQAYGHGGYFAQGFDSPIAKQYQENVKDMASIQAINDRMKELSRIMSSDEIAGQYRKFKSDIGRNAADEYDALMEQRNVIRTDPGHLYNVELRWPDAAREAADPLGEHHLLDWDAPLSEQPEAFNGLLPSVEGIGKVAAEKVKILSEQPGLADWAKQDLLNDARQLAQSNSPAHVAHLLKTMQLGYGISPSHGPFANVADDFLNFVKATQAVPNMNTGGGAVSYLEALHGEKGASDALRKAGIPGIRYLDQGSRVTSGGDLVDVFKGPQGWHSKIKVTNRSGAGFSAPTDSFTTSMPFKTEQEARDWAASKIGAGTRNYVMFDDALANIVSRNGVSLSDLLRR